MKKFIPLLLIKALLFFSCAHDPDEVKEIDTRLTEAGTVGKRQIGVDANNRMIVQTQKELDDELRSAVWFNSQMLFEVRYLLFRLKSCFAQKKDQIVSGDFETLDIAVVHEAETKTDKEDLGINSDGQFRLVTKEGYTKRLAYERDQKKRLVLLKEQVNDQLQRCEYQ